MAIAPYDLLIIGGGVNGCGIARDAAGRGLRVILVERGDLASGTSSASTKLFHGGLRYLEFFEFKLVRDALIEREILLKAMPHISWPLRFVLPYHRDMRFASDSPTSRLLRWVAPWSRGRRPAWLLRLGLALYDALGGREILPGARRLRLSGSREGAPLQERFTRGFEYSDCWVDDARLVVLNARDAAEKGAEIRTQTRFISASAAEGVWTAQISADGQAPREIRARMIVNTGGPWVADVLDGVRSTADRAGVRLVRGSHLVVRQLYDHDKCYFFQGEDGRIIFAIPYEQDFTLIGTTEVEHRDPAEPPVCSAEERDYLLARASAYFAKPVRQDDIVWSYAGVRALQKDDAASVTAATRDFAFELDETAGAPALSVYGGKITTYRRLAEQALERISAHLPTASEPWTAEAPLPGGAFQVDQVDALIEDLIRDYAFLTRAWAARLVRAYGLDAWALLGSARSIEDLGRSFGGDLTEREARWMMEREFARCADDMLWRRSKLGLRLTETERSALEDWLQAAGAARPMPPSAVGS